MKFPSWPCYASDEIAAVTNVLKSGRVNYWTGDEGRKFEREFADYHGVKYAVAVANGTVALDLALHALGLGSGDEVIVTPRTFIASVSCIINAGARPVFADVDPDSGNITPETVRAVLTPETRAIMAVHLAGWPCDEINYIWRNGNERTQEDFAGMDDRKVCLVRYEDFTANPAMETKRCLDFLQVSAGEEQISRAVADVSPRNSNAWKTRLSQQDREKVLPVIKPLLEQYGYLSNETGV